MLNWRTSVLGQPSTCPKTGLQNEPKLSKGWVKIGTTNWTPYPIVLFSFCWFYLLSWIEPIRQIHPKIYWYLGITASLSFSRPYLCTQQSATTDTTEQFQAWFRVWNHIRTLIKRKRWSVRERTCWFYMLLHLTLWKFLNVKL